MPGAVEPGQYVYVVCATSSDHFAEMAAVSMTSLRTVSPRARIIVLTDLQTSAVVTPATSAIRASANDFKVVDCPGDSSFSRSRFLKSNMRRLVDGCFLYLDSDTFIMRSPDAVWSIDCDVAASPDLGSDGKPYLCTSALTEANPALGWSLPARHYLNAGVIYLSDTKGAHAAGELYRVSWMEYQRVLGRSRDQPAFNRAVRESGVRLTELPLSYNAQIAMNVMTLRHAVVAHYYTDNFESSSETVAHTLARRLKSDGVLDAGAIQGAIRSGNPWARIDSYRKAAATGRYWYAGRIAFDRLAKRLSA